MTVPDPSQLSLDLEHRLAAARAEAAEFGVKWNQISNLRLVIAAVVAGLGFWWIRSGTDLYGVLAAVAMVALILVIGWHQKLRSRRDMLEAIALVRLQSIQRVRRQWSDLPLPCTGEIAPDHPFAHDLDLTGRGSLLHLMDTTQTLSGRTTLREWLLNGAELDSIAQRQEIARDLVSQRDWREELQAAGMVSADKQSGDPDRLVDWLEQASLKQIGIRHLLAALMAVATLICLVLVAFEVIPFALVVPLFLLNGTLSFLVPRNNQINELNTHQAALRQYRHVLPLAEVIPGTRPETAALRAEMAHDGRAASRQLSRLDRTLSLIVPPSTMLWVPLQLAVNWDILVDARLTALARDIGPRIQGWLAAIGKVETVAALGSLQDLNPSWTWPLLSSAGSALQAANLGHPLLLDERRVTNDLNLGPRGHVLIVTGSNMAGKSTLLRSIGLNIVLARAGGPVCASALSVPNQPVWSSVRIQDSLEQGVSLYMAELLRLRAIVEAAQYEPITYLLDEILHGTNTAERRIAARTVIRKLLRTDSIGAVSTHDLELVDPELNVHATCVHLVDQVSDNGNGPEMTFDYKVRPGLAPSSNALRLLELVGLGE